MNLKRLRTEADHPHLFSEIIYLKASFAVFIVVIPSGVRRQQRDTHSTERENAHVQ